MYIIYIRIKVYKQTQYEDKYVDTDTGESKLWYDLAL
jgi:hypothetical protein